jgi:hypothetical protein
MIKQLLIFIILFIISYELYLSLTSSPSELQSINHETVSKIVNSDERVIPKNEKIIKKEDITAHDIEEPKHVEYETDKEEPKKENETIVPKINVNMFGKPSSIK